MCPASEVHHNFRRQPPCKAVLYTCWVQGFRDRKVTEKLRTKAFNDRDVSDPFHYIPQKKMPVKSHFISGNDVDIAELKGNYQQ